MSISKNDRIVLTGGGGFLGKVVVRKLAEKGYGNVSVIRKKDYDLVNMDDVKRAYADFKPDVVIHLAAEVGGIGANRQNPGRFFYSNLMMGVQMMEVARQVGLKKFVAIGTICAYPKFAAVPFKEDEIWSGYPEETNAPYGLAKKMLLVQSQAYRQQYGFNSVYLLPVNLYGPDDNFDLETSHVIPAIIRKCVEAVDAGRDEIVLWGSGGASREFLFVDDAADGIVSATERYESSEPVNLGSGQEIRIRDLATMIAELSGFKGRIVWDAGKPDGQPRRCLDTTRAEKEFGFKAQVSLRTGLERTIASYRKNAAEKTKGRS